MRNALKGILRLLHSVEYPYSHKIYKCNNLTSGNKCNYHPFRSNALRKPAILEPLLSILPLLFLELNWHTVLFRSS